MAVAVAVTHQRSAAGPRRRGLPGRAVTATVVGLALVAGGGWLVARERDERPVAADLLLRIDGLAYSTSSLRTPAGLVRLAIANTDAVPHTFTVTALGVDVEVAGGEAVETEFSATAGAYEFICTIPGHDTPEMRGVLTVHD